MIDRRTCTVKANYPQPRADRPVCDNGSEGGARGVRDRDVPPRVRRLRFVAAQTAGRLPQDRRFGATMPPRPRRRGARRPRAMATAARDCGLSLDPGGQGPAPRALPGAGHGAGPAFGPWPAPHRVSVSESVIALIGVCLAGDHGVAEWRGKHHAHPVRSVGVVRDTPRQRMGYA
jgi:hypothetical protein